MFAPDFKDPHVYHHVQLLCEVHRYGSDVGHKERGHEFMQGIS